MHGAVDSLTNLAFKIGNFEAREAYLFLKDHPEYERNQKNADFLINWHYVHQELITRYSLERVFKALKMEQKMNETTWTNTNGVQFPDKTASKAIGDTVVDAALDAATQIRVLEENVQRLKREHGVNYATIQTMKAEIQHLKNQLEAYDRVVVADNVAGAWWATPNTTVRSFDTKKISEVLEENRRFLAVLDKQNSTILQLLKDIKDWKRAKDCEQQFKESAYIALDQVVKAKDAIVKENEQLREEIKATDSLLESEIKLSDARRRDVDTLRSENERLKEALPHTAWIYLPNGTKFTWISKPDTTYSIFDFGNEFKVVGGGETHTWKL